MLREEIRITHLRRSRREQRKDGLPNMRQQAEKLQELLGLRLPPVAITFRPTPPPGVSRIDSPEASGCTYWKLASDGRVFYTEAADHYNCPIGAYIHGIELPAERQGELQGLIGTMLELEYLREAEIANIPRRAEPFGVAIYSPWALAPCDADVVLVRGNAKQFMFLAEAARAAGIGDTGELMGRPTWAMIPSTLQHGRATFSLGCVGNRVYTGLADDEQYAAIPGPRMDEVLKHLGVIVEANSKLENFHRQRLLSC